MASSSLSSSNRLRSPSALMQLFFTSKRDDQSSKGRMLVSIRWMGSIWEVRLVMRGEETVSGVIRAALAAFAEEGRSLPCGPEPHRYHLFSSPYALQSLNANDSLMDLGTRSFVLRTNVGTKA